MRHAKGETRQNYYYFAELRNGVNTDLTSDEGTLKWFDFSELNSLEMAFTTQFVIEHYLEFGIKNDILYGGIADGEKVVFTELPEF